MRLSERASLDDGVARMKSMEGEGEGDVVRDILLTTLAIPALGDNVSHLASATDMHLVER